MHDVKRHRNGTESNSAARILDAALSLFSEKGYEATTTRELCELAGITKPTLYYFYKSKEGVYRALIRASMDEYEAMVQRAMARPGPLKERLKHAAQLMFADSLRNPRLVRFLFAIVYSPNAPLAAEVHKPYMKIASHVAAEFDDAIRRRELRRGDTATRVLVMMGAMGEAISNFLVVGEPKLTRRLAHSIVDTIFDGWQQPKQVS